MDAVTIELVASRYLVRPGRRLTVRATVLRGVLEVVSGDRVLRRLGPGDRIAPSDFATAASEGAIRASTAATVEIARSSI